MEGSLTPAVCLWPGQCGSCRAPAAYRRWRLGYCSAAPWGIRPWWPRSSGPVMKVQLPLMVGFQRRTCPKHRSLSRYPTPYPWTPRTGFSPPPVRNRAAWPPSVSTRIPGQPGFRRVDSTGDLPSGKQTGLGVDHRVAGIASAVGNSKRTRLSKSANSLRRLSANVLDNAPALCLIMG